MSMKETGSCLCGDVSYRLDRDAVMANHHCHCKDCQKATGAGKTTFVVVPVDAIEITGELKAYSNIGTKGKHINRCFCPNCGSQVLSRVDEVPDIRIVKAGTLDDNSWLEVISSFWCESAAEWAQPVKDLPAYDRNPPT